MKHNLLIVALLLGFYIRLMAVPALPTSKIVTQKDLTRIEVFLHGDEYCHCYFTNDYIPVSIGEDGSYYYMLVENDELKLSTLIAHEKNERKKEELDFIRKHSVNTIDYLSKNWTERSEKANIYRRQRSVRNLRRSLGEQKTYLGKKKGLVILVNFTNMKMSMHDANEYFNKMFNEIGFHENGAIGSVHDYFFDQSYGKFDLTFDVIGPVTVSNTYGYYGSNGISLDGSDLRAGEMIVEACQLADKEVNYADYDWDNDGEVDQVFIIYAGYGEASGGANNTIWPHESHLEQHDCGVLCLDGVRINTYACSCELTGGSGSTLNGMGTACHEFTHCLGVPDFYDTEYNGGFGMSYWDLMSSGSYCGPKGIGEVPTGYSSYERWYTGWLEIQELKEPCVIAEMPCINDSPVAYAIYNDNYRDEYFLLENRQNTRWYSYVGTYTDCHGLLAIHVDFSETAWKKNKVNSLSKHQRMTIIPADISYGTTLSSEGRTYYTVNKTELQGDLFPGLSKMTELTNTSHDNAGGRLYNLNTDGSYKMNKPLTNITEQNGLISFYFKGGIYVPTPEVFAASAVTDNSFTANWSCVEDADYYSLELSVMKPQGNPLENIILSESLAKFKTGNKTADGYDDLSEKLDFYMHNKGWKGQKVFTSQYGVKLGTTSIDGFLTTPLLNVENSNLTIRFSAKAASSDGATIQFILMTSSGTPIGLQNCNISENSDNYLVNFDDLIYNDVVIKITSSDRFYISDIALYDGCFAESDFDSSIFYPHMAGKQIITVDCIIDNKYVFSDLSEDNYRYRVRANMKGAKSEWSRYQEVNIEEEVDVRNIDKDEDSFNYSIYNLSGTKVKVPISSGIYIYRDKRGIAKKIYNKIIDKVNK